MKNILFLVFISILIISCKQNIKPDVIINGKYYIYKTECIEKHTEQNYKYHYGYSLFSGKYNFHYGVVTETICDKETTYLIEIDTNYYKIIH